MSITKRGRLRDVLALCKAFGRYQVLIDSSLEQVCKALYQLGDNVPNLSGPLWGSKERIDKCRKEMGDLANDFDNGFKAIFQILRREYKEDLAEEEK